MPTVGYRLNELIDELLSVLADDVTHLEQSIERLRKMREHIIKRNENDLRSLLEEIQQAATGYQQVERRRAEVRGKIADLLGLGRESLTLTRLRDCLDEPLSLRVWERQGHLRELAEKMQREHSVTLMLLHESARFNSLLLRSIFGQGTEAVTYTARGESRRQGTNGLMSYRF